MDTEHPTILSLRKKVLLAVVLLGCAVVSVYFFTQRVNPETKALFQTATTTQRFTDINGSIVELSDYLGSTLVVTSWASWSPFTADDFRALQTLEEEFRDTDISFVALNRSESTAQANRFLSTISVPESIVVVLDPADTFYSRVGGYAMPETVVFDARGTIVAHIRGPISIEALRETLNSF